MPQDFIQTRLEALDQIDDNIVKLLDNIGIVLEIYSKPSKQENDSIEIKDSFEASVRDVYSSLSSVAISLRNEIKTMDENIGVSDKNDDLIMILPISVEQKNTTLGLMKQNEELLKLQK